MRYTVEIWDEHYQRRESVGTFNDFKMAMRWAEYQQEKGNDVRVTTTTFTSSRFDVTPNPYIAKS